MKKLICLFIVSIFLCGCTALPLAKFLPFGGSSESHSSKDYEKIELSSNGFYPSDINNIEDSLAKMPAEGKINLRIIRKSSQKLTPKRTAIQKAGDFIGGLGAVAFIALVIGFFVAPLATVGIVASIGKKWKNATIQIAKAIKVSGVLKSETKEDTSLEVALKTNQSMQTQELIGKIKGKL